MKPDHENSRIIMHIDMDAFFAAIEVRDDPSLKGKPVIIGAKPGGRGVVSTASYEARKFGVHSAQPISEAYRRCPQGIYIKPSGRRYADESRRIMALLRQISPLVEPVSVDEAYVDITGLDRLYGDARSIGMKTKTLIKEETELSASVGIGPNRLVAKIASDFEKPDGLTIVEPDQVLDFLAPLPVGDLRGVGKVARKKLETLGIYKVFDLRRWSLDALVQRFGESYGNHLYRQARGIASDVVGEGRERKSISKEHTFGADVREREILRETLRGLAEEVGRKARRLGLKGRAITLKIRLEGFETHTRSQTLDQPGNADRMIFETAWNLYEKSGFGSRPVRLIGVGLSDWGHAAQLDLFAREDKRESKLLEVKDAIVERFGKAAVGVHRKQKNGDD